ncbi:peptidoglycan-binding domain-containing protein [Gellertiella hungarica]|uniref:Peptidoglycan hydrolase-like protein with peptidoglycan-binding domain n=1 Tax=Gellertiella hungarica TaxID=1572859 RepID=A0A7W6NLS9_9HYPH|nr:peptidoglycan-binding domain-containing protein [Gellertiella hungarica]MBB4065755.1 peptidoglycan hydrolase-like protein with peptidoglycan-binding domain [Gellertiella hungarica]
MAPRKPRAPEKKAPRPVLLRLLSTTALWLGLGARGLGRQAMRHPGPALATTLFLGVFGTIAANALWYQPHRLTSPFFATRDFSRFDALPGLRKATPPTDVTTFRIERQDTVVVEGEGPVSASGEAVTPGADADETASIIRSSAALPAGPEASATGPDQPENVALAVAVQQALIRRGLYNGTPDGVIGPRTTAAILFFQQTEGLRETGAVTEELLKQLSDGAPPAETTAAINNPATAPAAEPAEGEDPVAAAIRSAPVPAPRPGKAGAAGHAAGQVVKASAESDDLAGIIRSADGAGAAARPGKGAGALPADPEIVRQIQAGLARMSYPNVDPDGVAGPGTRQAIRQFQKYYRLPVTGEPSPEVLAKLKEIGAV